MEGHCSIGQNPQWAVVPMEEENKFETSGHLVGFTIEKLSDFLYDKQFPRVLIQLK